MFSILSNLKSYQIAPRRVIFNLYICCQFENLQIISPKIVPMSHRNILRKPGVVGKTTYLVVRTPRGMRDTRLAMCYRDRASRTNQPSSECQNRS